MESWQFWTLVVIGSLIILALVPVLNFIISAIFGFIFFISFLVLMLSGALYAILPESHEWYSSVEVFFWMASFIAVPSFVGSIGFALYGHACDRSITQTVED